MDNLFVARQPIYDSKDNLKGYELLYRAGNTDVAEFEDGKVASSQVILNSFLDVGFDHLIGSTNAFINITEDFILDESLTPMYEKQIVLELLEEITPSAEVIKGVKRLKNIGYKIALDDFKYSHEYDELLELSDFVKLDVIDLGEEGIIRELDNLNLYDVKIIAEKVETQEMHAFCKNLDFDFFQGFYYCKPELIEHKSISSNKLVVLNVMKELLKPDFSFSEIEKALAQDATLTYKLLRYVNSAAFTQRREIESIKEALALIGGDIILKWTTLLLMMQLAEGKPHALLVTALVRAKMCELIGNEFSGQMFTIGLISLLDALMDVPLVVLLDDLTLSNQVKSALLDYRGENGKLLRNVIRYEQGNWDELIIEGVDMKDYFSSYMDAVKWADSTIGALQ